MKCIYILFAFSTNFLSLVRYKLRSKHDIFVFGTISVVLLNKK